MTRRPASSCVYIGREGRVYKAVLGGGSVVVLGIVLYIDVGHCILGTG